MIQFVCALLEKKSSTKNGGNMKNIRVIKGIALVCLLAFSMGLFTPIGAGKIAAAEKKLVVIDAGHQRRGNSSLEPIGSGASSKKAKVASGTTGRASGLAEYQLNLIVAKKLKKELESRGYEVKMIRTKHNVNISNAKRAKMANKWGADAFIRIHANGSTNTSISGALTMAPRSNNKYLKKSVIKKSQRLSKKMVNAFCKATGANNQGVMQTNDMSGINWCKVPVTIVEMGYMSNRKEDLKMASASYQKKMVKGMANGIDAYFK